MNPAAVVPAAPKAPELPELLMAEPIVIVRDAQPVTQPAQSPNQKKKLIITSLIGLLMLIAITLNVWFSLKGVDNKVVSRADVAATLTNLETMPQLRFSSGVGIKVAAEHTTSA